MIGVFGSAVVDIALVYHDDRTEEAANHFKRFKTCLFMYFCKFIGLDWCTTSLHTDDRASND